MRRLLSHTPSALLCLAVLASAPGLMAYSVTVSINGTLVTIPSGSDSAHLAGSTVILNTTLTSATAPSGATSASYPATISTGSISQAGSQPIILDGQSGTIIINTNGTISANFALTSTTNFNSTVMLTGVTLPAPVPIAFGTASFSAPASTVAYSVFGTQGTVGINGTISATGLNVSPLSITKTFSGGTAPSASPVSVTNTAGGSNYAASITGDTTDITITPTSGSTPGTVNVNFSSSAAVGTHNATLNINTSDNSGAPIAIPITYTVSNPSTITVTANPSAVSFAYEMGGTVPGAQSVGLTPNVSGTTYAAVAVGSTWLTASLSADLSTLTATVNPAGLSAGTYYGSIKVSGSTLPSSLYIPVVFTVSSAAALAAGPSAAYFGYTANAAAATSQTVNVSSTAGSAAFNATTDQTWLTVGGATGSAPGSVTVTASPSGLSTGTYTGNVTLAASDGSATVVIPVTMNVGQTVTPDLRAATNGASYSTASVAPGMIVSLFGKSIGPDTLVGLILTPDKKVPTSLGGVQVWANGIPCPVIFALNTQVNVILPFGLNGQSTADIQLYYLGVASEVLTMTVSPAAPGVFSYNASGTGGAAALNPDYTVNTADNAVGAGAPTDFLQVFGTGAGETNPASPDATLAPIAPPFPVFLGTVTATIAGIDAPILYAGPAPNLVSGVMQVDVAVPAGVPAGAQPLVISVNGVPSQASLVVYTK